METLLGKSRTRLRIRNNLDIVRGPFVDAPVKTKVFVSNLLFSVLLKKCGHQLILMMTPGSNTLFGMKVEIIG